MPANGNTFHGMVEASPLNELRMRLEATKAVGGDAEAMLAARARFILHDDLGQVAGSHLHDYRLTDEVRDRLIAHARQDAAHAVIFAGQTYRTAKRVQWITLIILALVLAMAWRVLL